MFEQLLPDHQRPRGPAGGPVARPARGLQRGRTTPTRRRPRRGRRSTSSATADAGLPDASSRPRTSTAARSAGAPSARCPPCPATPTRSVRGHRRGATRRPGSTRIDTGQPPARDHRVAGGHRTAGAAGQRYDAEGIFARPQGGVLARRRGRAPARGNTAGPHRRRRGRAAGGRAPRRRRRQRRQVGLRGRHRHRHRAPRRSSTPSSSGRAAATSRPATTRRGRQRPRIGRYDVATGTWSWFGYPLETHQRRPATGSACPRSSAVDDDTLAVIERDKLNGPTAADQARLHRRRARRGSGTGHAGGR